MMYFWSTVEESMETVDNPLHDAAKRGNMDFMSECISNRVRQWTAIGLYKADDHVWVYNLITDTKRRLMSLTGVCEWFGQGWFYSHSLGCSWWPSRLHASPVIWSQMSNRCPGIPVTIDVDLASLQLWAGDSHRFLNIKNEHQLCWCKLYSMHFYAEQTGRHTATFRWLERSCRSCSHALRTRFVWWQHIAMTYWFILTYHCHTCTCTCIYIVGRRSRWHSKQWR